MPDSCEWDPITQTPANNEHGCPNVATVSLGSGRKNPKMGEYICWHLCESCAALPRFKRFRKRGKLKG